MSKIEAIPWSADLDIGVPEIDLQHHKLVQLFNEANTSINAATNFAGWEAVVYNFLGYALYHFHSEEALAEFYEYELEEPSHALSHHQEHEAFMAHIKDVQTSLKSGNSVTKTDIMGFIRQWLINHIAHDDMPLAEFIRTKRAQL